MIQLTPTERAKLEGIVAAGGLTAEVDVVRVPVTPPDPEHAAAWKRYLARNYDSLVAMTQRICGPLDLILFDGNTVTVCRHPHTRIPPERIRTEVFSQLSERLFGQPQSASHWSKVLRAQSGQSMQIEIALAGGDEELSPQMEHAIRVIAGLPPPPEPEAPPAPEEKPVAPPLDIKMQRVLRPSGQNAVWLKASQPKLNDAQRDYFRAGTDIAAFDVQLAQQAAEIASRMIANNQPAAQLMFPLNINVLRTQLHRQNVVTALRELQPAATHRMEPVLVRCETGVPQSVISEAAGYLRKTFGLVWVFAGRNADPRTFLWKDLKMGVVIGAADTPKPVLEQWRLASEKAGWQMAILS